VSVIITWGGRQTVIIAFFKALNYPFVVGNMRFRLMGFVYASLILLITHAAARIWRFVFQNKILVRSGIESGLQESITTIAVYVLWILGIIMALHAFGLNTTSLAVAFGALGIGLGFGLQTIFNNFISGIILLFERPIQVGDAIEINGLWAYVKKINVRSTVVQTWDNASLIIPNSEFVTNQVTNWSFKDLRLRRNINVGVAYGSDVELVRKSLLEVAEKTPRVLKHPKPDVLFTDFGDNSLVFRLRVWTLIDYMIEVETNIRFAIDRLFRERDIVIAFPQRDLHIKTVDASFPLDMRQKEKYQHTNG
jgi:small-conductance mechanosensitive channel